MKSGIALIVLLLGVASIVFGVLFITEAGPAKDEVAESIAPVTLAELDDRYEAAKTSLMAVRAAEEPQIQAGQAEPSSTYNYLTVQKTGLGLARANVGLADFTMYSGIINVIVGAGLLLAGVALLKKSPSAA
jgi:hypothetical protein